MIQYHTGIELVRRFNLSFESEITYSDYCKEMIYMQHQGIRFTDKALLTLDPHQEHDYWIASDYVEFCPWENVICIENIKRDKVLEEFSSVEIKKWLHSVQTPRLQYPFINARQGNIAFILNGIPKSERSKKGKQNLKQDVLNYKDIVNANFGKPSLGPVALMVEVFSSDYAQLPDLDRLSVTIMDAFEGTAYNSDKQVRHLQPRLFSSTEAYRKLQCRSNPMEGIEFSDMPLGSLYPLSIGVLDYYVVRIITYH